MSIKCLMLVTPDKKRFFTNIGSRKRLTECCRAFNAKMHVVRAGLKRNQLLTVQKLVSALCDKGSRSGDAEFEILEEKKPRSR